MIALLGSLIGFFGAWVPEIFKIFRDKSDKSHEITLLQMQIDAQKSQGQQHIEEIGAANAAAQYTALYGTYITKIEWVDALNGTVRPVMAYGFFVLYAAIKFLQFQMIGAGAPAFMYFDVMWTPEDQATFAAIISFYFGQRAIAKGK